MSQFTTEELSSLLRESHLAFASGDEELWQSLAKQIPLTPELAKVAKELLGVDELKKAGFNLSEAEATYGNQWLDA